MMSRRKKSNIPNPHDRFFRGIMQQQQVSQEFFQAFLPGTLRKHTVLESIRATSSSFIEPELREQINDLLFECQFKQDDKILDGYIYLLIEHQSRPEKFLPLRVFRYVLAALDKHSKMHPDKPLPPIYPMVFYQGEKTPYPYSMDLLELFDDPLSLMKQVLFQPVPLIDVNQLDTGQLQHLPWLQSATELMQHIRDADITATLVQVLKGLYDLLDHPNGVDFLSYLLHYAIEAGNINDVTEFYQIEEMIPDAVKEKVMTIAEMLKKQGWEKGLSEGIEKGIEKGTLAAKQETALNMLKLGSEPGFVCKATGLSEKEVHELALQMASKR
jgi:predicted transposase/invertase (TIGR01784 family)